MADDPKNLSSNPSEEEILDALESEDDTSLSAEIAKKWDPRRIMRMVARGAGKGEKLDKSTRRRYERKLGVDLGNVRIFSGEFAEEVTRAHRAEALTIGSTGMVLMGRAPERSMASRSGRALLAHELTHVAQATRGVHRKATFSEPTPFAEEAEVEAEAAEAEELAEGQAGDQEDQDVKDEKMFQLILSRVLDMLLEDERANMMRNGDDVWRP